MQRLKSYSQFTDVRFQDFIHIYTIYKILSNMHITHILPSHTIKVQNSITRHTHSCNTTYATFQTSQVKKKKVLETTPASHRGINYTYIFNAFKKLFKKWCLTSSLYSTGGSMSKGLNATVQILVFLTCYCSNCVLMLVHLGGIYK